LTRSALLMLLFACSSTAERFQLGTPPPTATADTAATDDPSVDTAPTGDTGGIRPEACDAGECVDVVFVVDSSRSMTRYQSTLSKSGAGFFETIAALDYHVGAISMDVSEPGQAGILQLGLGERFVTRRTPDPDAAFADMVQIGNDARSREAGIATAHLLIFVKPDAEENVGFRREGAPLHLVFVSDEDDQSDEDIVADATEAFAGLDGGTRAHSLVAYEFTTGERYLALTQTFGGLAAPIGSTDFTDFLDEVALRIVGP